MSGAKKFGIIAVVVAAAAGVGGYLYVQKRNRTPPTALVRSEIEKLIASPAVKVTNVTPTVTPAAAGHATVAYQAEGSVTEPLFDAAEPETVLRDQLKVDAGAWTKARKTLSGKTAPRILELAGLKSADATLARTTFLTTATPAGTKLTYAGTFQAEKRDDGWHLSSEQFNRTAGELRGKPRSAFEGPTTVVDNSSELEALKKSATTMADFPGKVEQGRVAFVKEREAQQEKIISELLDTIKAGTVYAGTASTGSDAPAKVFLEFTSLNQRSRQVAAQLRNDGSWSERRALKGAYSFDADAETLTVTLETAANQAVPGAGPVLADPEPWRLPFVLNGAKLTAHDQRRDFSLSRLSAPEVAAARQQVEGDALALREATTAGKIYRGTVRSRDGAHTETYFLRFTRQDADAGTLAATLAPVSHENWHRAFHGTLVLNRYRAQGAPLNLETRAEDAARGADASSPVGAAGASTVALKYSDGHLRGENADFTYDFTALSAAEIAKIEAAAAEREGALLAIVKSATAYSGTARLEGKTTTTERIRLRFREVAPHGTEVDGVIESLDRPGIFRDVHGSVDTYGKRLVLEVTGKGRTSAASRAGIKFPPLAKSATDQTLTLEIASTGLSGELKDWKLNFPASTAVAVTGDSTGDYPSASGAYVWVGGGWKALPQNNAKTTKSGGGNPIKAISGFFGSLRGQPESSSASTEKAGDLVFTGNEPAPTVDGRSVTVVYVGAIDADLAAKYSDSKYPEIEMAQTSRESDGSRKVPLMHIGSAQSPLGFRDRRVIASVDRVNENVIELSCTRTLGPGTYAVSANEQSFELNVQ